MIIIILIIILIIIIIAIIVITIIIIIIIIMIITIRKITIIIIMIKIIMIIILIKRNANNLFDVNLFRMHRSIQVFKCVLHVNVSYILSLREASRFRQNWHKPLSKPG